MIVRCAECGKKVIILYPHLWAYKAEGKHFCSWGCMRITEKRKEAKEMEERKERLKKDGTPAKRPGRKAAKDGNVGEGFTPEKREVPPILTAEEQEGIRKELRDQEKRFEHEQNIRPLEIAGVESRALRKTGGVFVKKDDPHHLPGKLMRLSAEDVEIILEPKEWRRLSAEILVALKQLGMGDNG